MGTRQGAQERRARSNGEVVDRRHGDPHGRPSSAGTFPRRKIADAVIFLDGETRPPNSTRLPRSIARRDGWQRSIPNQCRSPMSLGSSDNWRRSARERRRPPCRARPTRRAGQNRPRRAHITINRLALPVGEASALLAGFAIITTFSVRPWHRRGLQVLRLRCSTSAEEWRFNVTEASLLVVMGALLGVGVGVVGIVCVAAAANVTVRSTLDDLLDWHVLVPSSGWSWSAPCCPRDPAGLRRDAAGGPRRVWTSDVLALAAIGLWLFAAKRSTATTDTLRDWDRSARVDHAGARRHRGCRTHDEDPSDAAEGSRAPDSRTVLGCSPCCSRYSTTTPQNVGDCSVHSSITDDGDLCARVPPDAADGIVGPGPRSRCRWTSRCTRVPKLVPPQQVRSATSWPQDVNGVFASNVLRRGLSVRRSGTASDTVEVLGVSPQALDHLRSWRPDFGRRPRPDLIAVAPPSNNRGYCSRLRRCS